MPRRLKSLSGILCCLAFTASLNAAGVSLRPVTDPGSGIEVRLDSWLETCPPTGMIPLRVEIVNRSSAAHTWEISSHDGMGGETYTSSTAMSVEAGHSGSTTLYVLTKAITNRSSFYRNLNFSVNGPGVRGAYLGSLRSTGYSPGTTTEFIAMSTTLGSKGWSNLKSRFTSSSSSSKRSSTYSELDGCEVDMTSAPTDWRGYSGLVQLWMSDGDWMSMSEGSKAAMMEWVALGGSVMVMGADASDARLEQMKFPTGKGEVRRHGLGSIKAWTWNGSTLPIDAIVGAIESAGSADFRKHLGSYPPTWPLRKAVGALGLKHALIFGFVAAFGILMGPVNLFLLAPASRRQRLFVTVPAISLLGSAVLVALMIFQDGTGGNGARLTLALLMPDQKKMFVQQEQVTRTGVLLKRAFKSDEQAWMQPLELDDRPGYGRSSRDANRRYAENPFERSGDWFSSRSIQGQLCMASRPTRAAIEFTSGVEGTPPTVISTVEVPLSKLFVIDASMKIWTADNVGQGEKKVLKASTQAEFDSWLKTQKEEAGPVLGASLQTLSKNAGFAFAESPSGSKIAVKSLAGIRWENDRAIFAGPCLKP